MKIGLTRDESLSVPLGELLDLIAVEQIKNEGAKLKENETDEFFALLNRR